MTTQERTSRLPKFYKLEVEERLAVVQRFAGLSDNEIDNLRGTMPERLAEAGRMIENVAGLFHLPVGIAANFRLDGRDVLVPMVIEEPSVVAASSNAARMLRGGPGIITDATAPLMIGQIQLCDVPDLEAGRAALLAEADRLVELANDGQNRLLARGGGARQLEVRVFEASDIGPMLVVHLLVDVCDAMGANLVNGMAERLASECEELTGGRAFLRILSNLADRRLVSATGRVPLKLLNRPALGMDGLEVAERVVRASVFAEVDPYRAATHNKGIMNGMDAFLLATGQDWRAVEAGAHAYAARSGTYSAMAHWRVEDDELVGRIEVPMQVGVVGGVTRVHPVVKVLLKVVGAKTASDVGRVAAAAGLAQNLAAILALGTEGIQRGHMSLHARNIAAAAGARDHEIDEVVSEMIKRRTITHDAAEAIVKVGRDLPISDYPGAFGMAELQAVREHFWPAIEATIAKVMPRQDDEGGLSEVFWYQLDTGGKRLRAIIPLIVYEAFGGDPADAVPFAAAMELLHNATLVQMDSASRQRARRGGDAVWVRYGLDRAACCADAMVFAAMGCVGRLRRPPTVIARLARMVTSQMMEVIRAQANAVRTLDDTPATEDERVELARHRTGGLFGLSVTGGAILAEANDDMVDRLRDIGGHFGVIFQVQDELLGIGGGFQRFKSGATIIDGTVGILYGHCLSHCDPTERAELQGILLLGRTHTTAGDVRRAITLMRQKGSLAFGADLVVRYHGLLRNAAADLPQKGVVRLLHGITDIFLAPLLARYDR